MDMPKPGAAHDKLTRLSGRWVGEEKMFPSPWDPEGGTAIGRSHSRIALSGFALITDYEQERDGVITFTGHGVFSFDPKEELYSLHWFDCMGSPAEVFKGRFDGDTLTLAHGGPAMHARMKYDLSDPDHLSWQMEMSQDGLNWKTMVDGRYARKS